MKIGDKNPVRGPSPSKKSGGASGSSGASGAFESLLSSGSASATGGSNASSAATSVGSVDSMLALQGVSEEENRRRATVNRGHDMLNSLERLRTALLTGSIPEAVLRELEGRLRLQRAQISDPKLLSIIDDIELRVAVETAKLDVAKRFSGNETA